jgi:hypothetical protein
MTPRNCIWVLCGDLNMVECHENKSFICGKLTLENKVKFLGIAKKISRHPRTLQGLKVFLGQLEKW